MSDTIPEGRKFIYYLGIATTVLGILLFISVPWQLLSRSDRVGFEKRDDNAFFKRSLLGVGMVAVGQLLRRVGARGLAGSGVILDTAQAREDLEPYSRMAGGMVKDALDEADITLDGAQQVVKIKCRSCATLNDEDAKFCKACGQLL